MPDARSKALRLTLAPSIERRGTRIAGVDQRLHEVFASRWWRLGSTRRDDARVSSIERLGERLRQIDDGALAAHARALGPRLLRDDVTGPAVDEAFALIREATHRRLGLRHHRVQLLGGLVMVGGGLAEMQTGEGKTITALLPAITYALSGRPVHVVTVNDYLAERDAAQLRPVYEALGLSVSVAGPGQSSQQRRQAYAADVTYCTNKNLVFDYLRDRLARHAHGDRTSPQLLLRGLCFAIVDEADSVLIDEAQTPLIIAAERPPAGPPPPLDDALALARTCQLGRHFRLCGDRRQIELTPAGRQLVAAQQTFHGPWRAASARNELLQQSLAALHLYEKDRHYIVTDGKVQIVDEFTGRVMADRTWQHGLHQLIETKEGLIASGQRDTLAQISYQRFFRRYVRLAGMSGTVAEAAGEFRGVYGLSMRAIPTHRPSRRRCLGLTISATTTEKWRSVARAAERQAKLGRPVLIGTRSVAASEAVSQLLTQRGTAHVVLNARQDDEEAEAIAGAGSTARITVATNMAGRGTDIHLAPGVGERGGLHVILTEYHESARIDRQLIGRAGRQGDPGSYEIVASLEDDIFARFAPGATRLARIAQGLVPARYSALLLRHIAQSSAERASRRLRRRIVRRDQELERTLFFSGTPD